MNTLNFLSIDFETANPCLDSICQIGIAEFENGEITNRWNLLIDPEDWFDPMNISIHKITPEIVKGKQNFNEVYPLLKSILENKVVVHHTSYDKTAFIQACNKYKLEPFSVKWLDTARVVRRTWEQFKDRGYGLKPVADFLNIEFKHHDALEDAITCGKILLEASKIHNLGVLEWIEKINKRERNSTQYTNSINQEGNPDGDLFGEILVFTGSFFLPKKELSPIAAEMGCKVESSFTSKTTILVVGTQNEKALRGESKSSKHKAAEKRIEKGENVRILSEQDFIEIFKLK